MLLLLHIRGILRKQNKQTMLPWLEGRRPASRRREMLLQATDGLLYLFIKKYTNAPFRHFYPSSQNALATY